MSYDSILSQAKRLVTIFRDVPWVKNEMIEIFPLLVAEIERLEDRIDESDA